MKTAHTSLCRKAGSRNHGIREKLAAGVEVLGRSPAIQTRIGRFAMADFEHILVPTFGTETMFSPIFATSGQQ
jgi:hypothetical protein